MDFLSDSWIWLYIGAFLMLAEILTPGFVVFFFGLSAMTVGLLSFAFGDAFNTTWQLAAFSVFAILYLAVLRRWLRRLFSGRVSAVGEDFEHEYVGRIGTVVEAVKPPLADRIEIGDAQWTAEADTPLDPGDKVKVVARRNLTMKVEPL